MAKTKRRSCKGGRKSRKCRGGTKYSYNSAYNIPYSASSEARGFGSHSQGVSRFGDTKQAELRGPSNADTVNEVERDAKIYMRMRPIRKLARGFKESVLGFPGTLRASTASAARGLKKSVLGLPGTLRASVSGIYKKLTTDPRFEKDKLLRANMETKDANEGAGVQNFLKRSNEIYDSNYHKVGQYYDGHPYFLPGHYDPEDSWTMSRWGGH